MLGWLPGGSVAMGAVIPVRLRPFRMINAVVLPARGGFQTSRSAQLCNSGDGHWADSLRAPSTAVCCSTGTRCTAAVQQTVALPYAVPCCGHAWERALSLLVFTVSTALFFHSDVTAAAAAVRCNALAFWSDAINNSGGLAINGTR